MNESKFWQLLEYAKAKSNGDLDEQHRLIVLSLAELELSELMEFDAIRLEKKALAYDCSLWDAGHLLMIGCGDDSFDDFREWLITQGEAVFYTALKDPDSLANIFEAEEGEFDYIESILFISFWDAYKLRTGLEELPKALRLPKWELKGEFCDEDELEEKYPKLFALHKRWYGSLS